VTSFTFEAAIPRYAFVEVVEEELVLGRVGPSLCESAGRSVETNFACKLEDGDEGFIVFGIGGDVI
jgi:hypothetical protein